MNAIAWIVAQSRRLDLPCGAGLPMLTSGAPARAPGPDAADRTAEWVVSTRRRVTWVDVAERQGCHRYHAMKLLRVAAERGLLRRIPSTHKQRPDLFEGR